jgi:transposase InsO family protein
MTNPPENRTDKTPPAGNNSDCRGEEMDVEQPEAGQAQFEEQQPRPPLPGSSVRKQQGKGTPSTGGNVQLSHQRELHLLAQIRAQEEALAKERAEKQALATKVAELSQRRISDDPLERIAFLELPKFFGTMEEIQSGKIDAFVHSIARYMKQYSVSHATMGYYAGSLLKDGALTWFHNYSKVNPGATWCEIEAALLAAYRPSNFTWLQAVKFTSLKLGKNERYASLIARHQALSGLVTTDPELVSMGVLLNALPPQTRREIQRVENNCVDTQSLYKAILREEAAMAEVEPFVRGAGEAMNVEADDNIIPVSKVHSGQLNPKRNKGKRCSYCRNYGHTRIECRKKLEDDLAKSARPIKSHKKDNNDDDKKGGQANTASSGLKRGKNPSRGGSKKVRTDFSADNSLGVRLLIDSACTNHMIGHDVVRCSGLNTQTTSVQTASGESLAAFLLNKEIKFNLLNIVGGHGQYLELLNVLLVPELKKNLFSVREANRNGLDVHFYSSGITSLSKHDCVLLSVKGSLNELPYFEVRLRPECEEALAVTRQKAQAAKISLEILHSRLGHPGLRVFKEMCKRLERTDLFPKKFACEACVKGKSSRPPAHPTTTSRNVLELVHMDLVGPINPPDQRGYRWILTIIDDSSKFLYTVLLADKTNESILDAIEEFIPWAERASNTRLIAVRSDQGSEFISRQVTEYFDSKGISQQFSNAGNPSQNGNIERVNRTLVEKARTLLCESGFPLSLWGEMIVSATVLYNGTPHSSIKFCTPAELFLAHDTLRAKYSQLETLRVIGCKAVAHYSAVASKVASKFDAKASTGFLVGYALDQPGYRIWYPAANKVHISNGVTFFEDTLYKNSSYYQENDGADRLSLTPSVGSGLAFSVEEKVDSTALVHWALATAEDSLGIDAGDREDPKSLRAALHGPDADLWSAAMDEELQMLHKNETWSIVPRPPGINIVGSKWVFRVKRHPDGTIDKYKARLVAQGFSQAPGVDFDATFAPTISRISLRVFLLIASHHQMLVHQMDAKSAFLQGTLDRDIYVSQPPGKEKQGTTKASHVCKLNKALYGLRQSPLVWNMLLTSKLQHSGFKQLKNEPCLFIKHMGKTPGNGDALHEKELILLAVYVDDITIAAKTMHGIRHAKAVLKSHFEMTDLGPVQTVLGLTITRDESSGGYKVNQDHYIAKLVQSTELENSRVYSVPMDPGLKLTAKAVDEQEVNSTAYRSIVGGLLYASTLTRPDIAYATNVVSRFMSEPGISHMKAAKRIVQYLATHKSLDLHYRRTSSTLEITAYSDADFAGDLSTRKSTSGFVIFINGQPVSWKSAKQTSVSTSTVEAEYIAAALAAKEALWIRNLVEEILADEHLPQILLHVDNTGAKSLAEAKMITPLTKHIDVGYHLIRDLVEHGHLKIVACDTKLNIADIFTKALTPVLFDKQLSDMTK